MLPSPKVMPVRSRDLKTRANEERLVFMPFYFDFDIGFY